MTKSRSASRLLRRVITRIGSRNQLPQSIKINGATWKVKLVAGMEKRTGNLGTCTRYNRTIKIDADQSREGQEITFIHEILHAVWPTNIVGDRTEERLVEALDEKLHEVFTKNKL